MLLDRKRISVPTEEQAVEGVVRLIERGHNIEFVLAGPIADAGAESLIARMRDRFGQHFSYLGALERHEVPGFFQRIDLFLFPTRYRREAQSLVVLEAMASAVPMITSNVGYLAELLGGSGVVLGASEKSGSYVRSIETLLANVEERTALGRRARSRFEALLLDSTKSQDDLLTDIVSGCPPGGW